jgi:hypothetical protein
MFKALIEKRAAYRAYKEAVEDCLTVLFCGFPEGALPSLRHRLGDAGFVRRAQAGGTDARICAVQVTILLVRRILDPLRGQERQDLARAFLRADASNSTFKGFKSMFRVVRLLQVPPALVTYFDAEVAGHLRGLPQKAIFNAWVEGRIDDVMGRFRERCLAEAETEGDLQH